MTPMTRRERLAAAMDRRVPDRVPVMCQMSIGHMLIATGLSPAALWHSAEAFTDAIVGLAERYGFDGILVSLHGHRRDWERDVLRIERDDAAETVIWKDGRRDVYPRDDLPMGRPDAGPKPPIETFDPDSLPGEIGYIPVSQGLRFDIDPADRFRSIDLVRARGAGRFSVHGEVTSPFDYFLDLFGFAEGFIALADQPDRARAVLSRFADGIGGLASAIASRGVDAVKISSPWAGAGFISPAFYRAFVAPYEARVAAAVRSHGVPVYTHTCGDVHDRLEAMADTGISGVECLDPPPLGRVDLADAKRRIGGRLFIKGNIDPVNTLLRGPVAEVRRDALRRLAIGSPGGGFILSSACSIAPHTPPEHIRVLAEAADEFGAANERG